MAQRLPHRPQPAGPAEGLRRPLDAGHGPRLGPVATHPRIRSGLRPGRRRPVSPPGAISALAARPRSTELPDRPDRGRRPATDPAPDGGMTTEADAATEIVVGGRRIRVTNPDRVLWPETGFTKGAMIDYYLAVAGTILPHLHGRGITLRRFPEGVDGPGWYQANCRGRPPWVSTH